MFYSFCRCSTARLLECNITFEIWAGSAISSATRICTESLRRTVCTGVMHCFIDRAFRLWHFFYSTKRRCAFFSKLVNVENKINQTLSCNEQISSKRYMNKWELPLWMSFLHKLFSSIYSQRIVRLISRAVMRWIFLPRFYELCFVSSTGLNATFLLAWICFINFSFLASIKTGRMTLFRVWTAETFRTFWNLQKVQILLWLWSP